MTRHDRLSYWICLLLVSVLGSWWSQSVSAAGPSQPVESTATELAADYDGQGAHLLERDAVEPRALATGDFDENGMPDLIVGYATEAGGLFVLHRGNVDAVFPSPGQPSTDAFHPDATVFALSERADFVGCGDFDADGHMDVVTARRGSSVLLVRRGDGRGSFSEETLIPIDGSVTALVAGDVNRRDGLADVIVGVDGWDRPHLLVFEWPEGALRGAPERIDTDVIADSIHLGRYDEDGYIDIVATGESEAVVTLGRDRRLSWGRQVRTEVQGPEPIRDLSADEALESIGSVKHTQAGDARLAAVEMRLNRDALADTIVIEADSRSAVVMKSTTDSTFIVDSTADNSDFDTGDGLCDTDDSVGDGPCTLRAAIEQANASSGADTIEFDIPGSGPHTIQPASAFPALTGSVTIDGFSQPGSSPNTIPFPGALDTIIMVDIDGSLVPPGANGFVLSGGSSTIRGLVIRGFLFSGAWTGAGVRLDSSGHIVEGCFIGTDPSGTLDRGNEMGILIYHGSNNLIGGSLPEARNLLSGNDRSHGVEIYGFSGSAVGNMIQGNLIGTDISGTLGILGDYSGTGISVTVYSEGGNLIGGSGPGEGNVISIPSFCSNAVDIYAGPSTMVQGNLIGTDAEGSGGIGSVCTGVFAYYANAVNCTIGGTQPGAGNVISGNTGYGVFTRDGGWTVQGNFIGVLADGTTPLSNGKTGVYLTSESDGPIGHLIGGDVAGAGNVIANNIGAGSPSGGILLAYPDAGWPEPTQHSFLGNSIFNNFGLGIEICSTPACTEGPTPNDPGDPDTGSNNLQNFPVVSGVSSAGGVVDGTLNSTPSTTFRLEFFASTTCDSSGYGEGETYLGADTVTTDVSGDAAFSSILAIPAPFGSLITATATDPAGNTSEFSACFEFVVAADLGISKDDGVTEVIPGGQVTYTIVADNAGPDDMPGSSVSDVFPTPVSCTWTCVGAGAATCTAGPVAGDIGDTVDLPVGGTVTYTAVCDVDRTATGSVFNTASVAPPAGVTDPNLSNNSATDVDAVLELDFGDAPDPSYPTLWDSDGARHLLGGGLFLGATVDADSDGQPTAAADGDDTDGNDDEDGVVFTSPLVTGYTASIEVTASAAGLLNAWIDFNADGDWADAGEQVFADEPLAAGVNSLVITVPATAVLGESFARFRVDTSGGLAPTGLASDGEVEDYVLNVRSTFTDVPQTGQTISYAAGDDGTFQSGIAWPEPRFVDHGDGTITDRLTGLMWTQDNVTPGPPACNPGVQKSWWDSFTHIDCLNAEAYLGHTDWRLPNVIEIHSLAHLGETDQRLWLASLGFTLSPYYYWWSSTTPASSLSGAFTLSHQGASYGGYNKNSTSGPTVWPVRGSTSGGIVPLRKTGQVRCWNSSYVEVPCAGTGQDGDHQAGMEWPSPRFEVNGDCVTDRMTGLMWTKDGNLFGSGNWAEAIDNAEGLVLCGHDDWRLPTKVESDTLIHFDRRIGPVPPTMMEWWENQGFVNTSQYQSWTGTTQPYDPNSAYKMQGGSLKTSTTYVTWPVRGNLPSDGADLGITMTDSADPVGAGEPVTYTIEVMNLGPHTADEVTVTNTLPAGSTFTDALGAGWSCGEDTGVVTCVLASLAVGPAAPISIEITVPVTPGSITNTALVDSLQSDLVPENNAVEETTDVGEFDFGDAPDPSFPTLLASNGARHVIDGTTYLGAGVDGDIDGQPTANADGDDTDAQGDDEDGVSYIIWPVAGQTATVRVMASTAGFVNAWIDYNADGDWADAGEHVFVDVAVAAGQNNLDYAIPITAVTGVDTFARFRFNTAGGLSYDGLAPDGEVEDYKMGIMALDYGDAPDPTYPTLDAGDGARHIIGGGLYLGASVDFEADGQPTASADGDDLDGNDDEDGVVFTSGIGAGLTAFLDVTSSGVGKLNAWVDFNADGDWADAGEQVFTDRTLVAGVNFLSFAVPASATLGTSYARFRLDTNGGLAPNGYATDGEVEDYQVEIVEGPDLQIEMAASSAFAPSGASLTYTITVTNNGPLSATSVTVTDTLPGELIFVSSTPGAPDCTFAADTLTCDLGTMAPTDTAVITVDTVLDYPVYGSLSNAATVTAAEIDPIQANNTAAVDTVIALFVDGFETGDTTWWD